MRRAPLLALAAVALAGCGGTTTVTVTRTVTTTRTVTGGGASAAACTGADLGGGFDVVHGSAGAGQIVYRLTLRNASQAPCFVSGRPQAELLDSNGSSLPTHVVSSGRGVGTAARIVLQPGDAATSEARFSPDVPGTGDAQTGRCQPVASTLRVTPDGGGTVDVPIRPPTSVCEQGRLQFDLFSRAG